jgi:hypothetical protein
LNGPAELHSRRGRDGIERTKAVMHMNGFQDGIDKYNSRHVKWLDVTKRCSFGRGRSRLVEAVLEVDCVEYKALSAPIKISVRGDRSLSRVVGLADGGGWHANGKRGFANVVQADRFLVNSAA